MPRWLNWSSKLLDDRGDRHPARLDPDAKPVSLRLLSRKEAAQRIGGPPHSQSAAFRVELLQRDATLRAGWLLVAVLIVPLVMLAGYVIEKFRSDPVEVLLVLTLVLACVALFYLIDRRSVASIRRKLPDLPPACLACRYDLTGVPPAGDGCTVCPECGAAWDFGSMD